MFNARVLQKLEILQETHFGPKGNIVVLFFTLKVPYIVD